MGSCICKSRRGICDDAKLYYTYNPMAARVASKNAITLTSSTKSKKRSFSNKSKKSICNEDNLLYTYNPKVIEQYNLKNTKKFYPEIRNAYVVKVYDGDTITIVAPVLNSKNNDIFKFSVRILGIDCPEIRSKNSDEKDIAIKARDVATFILLHKHVILDNIQYDKYGRVLATIFIDGENFSEIMLRNGLAYEYNGKKKCPPKNWVQFYQDKQ